MLKLHVNDLHVDCYLYSVANIDYLVTVSLSSCLCSFCDSCFIIEIHDDARASVSCFAK